MNQLKKNLLLSGALTTAATLNAYAQSESIRPNIILINIDDLGWSDMGAYGSTYYQTPNLDKLSEQSTRFTQAYAGAANSAPSRACLMTGQYSPRHGVYTVNPADRGKRNERKLISAQNRETIPTSSKTIAQALKEVGYNTAHIGKWHLGEDATKQGMDINIAGNLKGHPKSYFSPYHNPDLTDGEDGEYLTDRLANEAIAYLDSQSGDVPFFLHYATYAVHTPLQPKPELLAKYQAIKGDENHNNPKYAALLESVDYSIGRVLQHLEDKGLNENTLIILTSDNGGLYSVSKQTPLRAGKGSYYEGGIRVPMMVRWDGVLPSGATSDMVVSQLDIYPTIMEAANHAPANYTLDGESLLTHLNNKGDKALSNRAIFWHFPAYLENGNDQTTDPIFRSRPVSVIRRGDWKLIYNYESQKGELYNIKEDISERRELSGKESKKAKAMHKELFQWLKATNAPHTFELNPHYKPKN